LRHTLNLGRLDEIFPGGDMLRTIATFICVSLLSVTVFAFQLSTEEKLSDLNQLVSLIKSSYGPLEYKESRGLNLKTLHEAYAEKIRQTTSNGEFYYLIRQFVSEFDDSHFGIMVPAEQMAMIPFSVDLVEGKPVIDEVMRQILPESNFPFQRGDEIVAIDGVPAAEVLQYLMKYVGMGFELTQKRYAAMLMTFRPSSMVPVPMGKIAVFSFRRGKSDIIETKALPWLRMGMPLDEVVANPNLLKDIADSYQRAVDYDQLSIMDLNQQFSHPQIERSFRCSGTSRIKVPDGATVLMKAPFVAYYHPTPEGNVGYVRIPHYMPMSQSGQPEFDLRFSQYEWVISELEKHTVGMIIDQDHNCGGSVSYLHKLVSLFVDKPYQPVQFKLLATKETVLSIKGWARMINPNTLAARNIVEVLKTVMTSWAHGETMTPLTALAGQKQILPHSITYSKPIVILIDEMSGSGGDAFPAVMQGIGRAKLLGTRTMGAGGHVTSAPALFYSQMPINITKSLFFRPDRVEVENNGAEPDFPYTITHNDYLYGYRNYQAFYLEKLKEQLKPAAQ
jgi:hypothetical protein